MNDKVKADAILFAIILGFIIMISENYELALMFFVIAWSIKFYKR
jgi:hypothetical protein